MDITDFTEFHGKNRNKNSLSVFSVKSVYKKDSGGDLRNPFLANFATFAV